MPTDFAQHAAPRILFLDIETKFILVGSFGIREQNLSHHQIVDDGEGRLIHCIAYKWAGDKRAKVLTEWQHGYEGMIRGIHEGNYIDDSER